MAQPEADPPQPPPPPPPPSYWASDSPGRETASFPPANYSSGVPATPGPSGAPAKSRAKAAWIIVAVALAALILVSFGSARHWTKTDVPEHPETFHSEQYTTGAYNVSDDGISPCWVDQVWADCINAMVNQYNWACAGIELTVSAKSTCDAYGRTIDEMKADDGPDYFVASLGGYGHLQRDPERSNRRVSNNDYRPSVTHEAVCYLGFIGECE